ncbi:MAG: MBL fold metallo-hydrolase [Lachnospiraceae bacterium]|nr:MBL fold metallo-hydrolase [Lachnospiraceae bacterium]
MNVKQNEKGQAIPTLVEHIGEEAFGSPEGTEVRWLSGGAAMINARGTVIMIDPVLEGFDMPLTYDPPIAPEEVKRIDGYLVTHIDNDHFSKPTIHDTAGVTGEYHTTQYVAEVMREDGIEGQGHAIGDEFDIGNVHVRLTPAWHNWQNGSKKWQYREWKREDYCGFYMNTPDGSIWMPGDSKLLDEQLAYEEPDVILLDFADNEWHITFEGAVKLCNAYPNAVLIPIHWGSVDAPDWSTFNGDPRELAKAIEAPERLRVLVPGEAYHMKK